MREIPVLLIASKILVFFQQFCNRLQPFALLFLFAAVVCFAIVAILGLTRIDRVITSMSGKIVPAGQVSVLQALDPSIIKTIDVREGEQVQPGRPIISLLPPGNVRVRFFVPQAVLPKVNIGDRIAVTCDGCAGDIAAIVNFISVQAEFTPPVIYSQEERARLVFRVEATPEHPEGLRVGQPVSVALKGAAGVSHASK